MLRNTALKAMLEKFPDRGSSALVDLLIRYPYDTQLKTWLLEGGEGPRSMLLERASEASDQEAVHLLGMLLTLEGGKDLLSKWVSDRPALAMGAAVQLVHLGRRDDLLSIYESGVDTSVAGPLVSVMRASGNLSEEQKARLGSMEAPEGGEEFHKAWLRSMGLGEEGEDGSEEWAIQMYLEDIQGAPSQASLARLGARLGWSGPGLDLRIIEAMKKGGAEALPLFSKAFLVVGLEAKSQARVLDVALDHGGEEGEAVFWKLWASRRLNDDLRKSSKAQFLARGKAFAEVVGRSALPMAEKMEWLLAMEGAEGQILTLLNDASSVDLRRALDLMADGLPDGKAAMDGLLLGSEQEAMQLNILKLYGRKAQGMASEAELQLFE